MNQHLLGAMLVALCAGLCTSIVAAGLWLGHTQPVFRSDGASFVLTFTCFLLMAACGLSSFFIWLGLKEK